MHLIYGKNLWKGARKNITFSFSENFIKQKGAEKRKKVLQTEKNPDRFLPVRKNAGKTRGYLRRKRSILDLAIWRTASLPAVTIS